MYVTFCVKLVLKVVLGSTNFVIVNVIMPLYLSYVFRITLFYKSTKA